MIFLFTAGLRDSQFTDICWPSGAPRSTIILCTVAMAHTQADLAEAYEAGPSEVSAAYDPPEPRRHSRGIESNIEE